MIIIDSDNYAASGIETFFFSGGEPHAKIPDLSGTVVLFLKLRTWNDTGIAACVLDAVVRGGAEKIIAFIPYFPGARQDRSDGYSPITVELVGDLFGRYWNRVEIVTFDIHSERAKAMAGVDIRNMMPSHLPVPIKPDVVGIIAPDKGAADRATSFRDAFYPGVPVIQCSKKRNQQTGELSDYVMPSMHQAGRYIIVDDICDGGRTFNLLAEEFTKQWRGDSQLEMFVSHGIFSRGLGNIHPAIEHITTTDSWCRGSGPTWVGFDGPKPVSNRLTIIPLLPHLLGEE
jgi:ribose-phosphate pyrophosphokinase